MKLLEMNVDDHASLTSFLDTLLCIVIADNNIKNKPPLTSHTHFKILLSETHQQEQRWTVTLRVRINTH